MTTFIKGVRDLQSLANSEYRLTGQCWGDFDFAKAAQDPSYGFYARDPWKIGVSSSTAAVVPFVGTQATAGTTAIIAGGAGQSSLLELDSNSTTDAQGIQVQFTGLGHYLATGQTMYMEVMARAKDIATVPDLFVGAATIDTTIIASSAVSATNWIGYYLLDGGTGISFGSDDNSAPDAHSADVDTLVDGATTTDGTEWFRWAFKWVYGESIEGFVDSVSFANDSAVTAQPEGFIVPSLVCQSTGTTDPIVEVAHLDFAVKYR